MRPAGFLFVLVALAGCATGPPSDASRPRDVITRQEVLSLADAPTAYQVLEQLRPVWMRARNPGTPRGGGVPIYPVVFLDDQRLGGLHWLRRVSAREIQRIERLDMRTATIRYGSGYPGGIIRIITVP